MTTLASGASKEVAMEWYPKHAPQYRAVERWIPIPNTPDLGQKGKNVVHPVSIDW